MSGLSGQGGTMKETFPEGQKMEVKRECIHFRGNVPCHPHKSNGYTCNSCTEFSRREGRILIIKLGAAGDVIRTTPLLSPLKKDYPSHCLTWLTRYPEHLPELVDDPIDFTLESILWLRNTSFDLLINLDKDREACALTRELNASVKMGFTLDDAGFCTSCDNGPANDKILTGIFDDVNASNKLSYVQEIMHICGYEFNGEEYILDPPSESPPLDLSDNVPTIGLNTGCGKRWPSRQWPEHHWIMLTRLLLEAGFQVLLLGGQDEDSKNLRISRETRAYYPGHFNQETFNAVVDRCDLVVTAVTMAMHVAIGLRKKLVLFNNIFNPSEFELYGRGVILSPEQECTCFFQPECTNDNFCMDTLSPETVLDAVNTMMKR